MADPRTFTLIGEFKDGITPELEKINKAISTLNSSFASMSARGGGFKNITKSIGSLVSAHKNLARAVKEVREEMSQSLSVMKEYRREAGKAASATMAIKRMGSRAGRDEAKFWADANRNAQAYQRTLGSMGQRGVAGRRLNAPTGGRGGGGGGARPPAALGQGENYHMGAFAFGMTLGQGLSQPITTAIMSGFQMGVGLMMKPFQYFGQNFQERMRDELSDLKAAGGFFSISQRQKGDKLVTTFDQAVDFTQENNKILAKLAASLPGSTQDYIEVSKRISDSVARTVVADKGAAIRFAEELRKQDVSTYGNQAISGTGSGAMRQATQIMLGELTKQTVLAGQGGRAGVGGAMGAYGLPQLTERILSQQDVSMGQFQRYSAIFSDPMIMDALSSEIPKINKTAASSVERFKAIREMYNRVLPPELVERYRRTLAGVTETFNTAIFGPETGLFGLGRKMKGLGKKINEFGQYVDWYGKATTDVTKAMNADLSIYDLFRDIIANVGQILAPIVENITLLYDPLKKLGQVLTKARTVTAEVLRSFNMYVNGFEAFAAKLPKGDLAKFNAGGGAYLRGSIAAIGNLFRALGIISKSDFSGLIEKLKAPDAKMGDILKDMITKFFDSDAAKKIGEFIGTLIGTVLSEVANVTGFISKRLGVGKLGEGVAKGFAAAKGPEAVRAIFRDVFVTLFNVLGSIAKTLPVEAYALAAAAVIIPAAVAGLGMAVSQWVTGLLHRIATRCFSGRTAARAAAQAACAGGMPGGGVKTTPKGRGKTGAAGGFLAGDRKAARLRAGNINRIRRQKQFMQTPYSSPIGPVPGGTFLKGKRTAILKSGLTGAGKMQVAMKGLQKFGLAAGKVAGKLPGLSIAIGALDFASRKMSGESTAVAAGGAIGATGGSIAGGVLGTALGPGGTIAGSILGSIIGDWLGSNIAKIGEQLPAKLSAAWNNFGPNVASFFQLLSSKLVAGWTLFKNSIVNLPMTLGYAIGQARAQMEMGWNSFSSWFMSLGPRFVQAIQGGWSSFTKWFMGLGPQIRGIAQSIITGARGFLQRAMATLSNPSTWGQLAISLVNGIKGALAGAVGGIGNMFNNLKNWAGGFTSGMQAGYQETKGGYKSTATQQRTSSNTLWNFGPPKPGAKPGYAGSLGDAVSREMKMKPPGSSLVVANSSETIIPAAKGYGMSDFMKTMKTGFNQVIAQVKYGGGRGAKPGGGSANWMQILEQDYLKNLNKPIPGGPVRGSGRGGLDVWEGPQASYISPSSLQTTASRAGGGSSPVSINSPITIYQQPGQDSEELAAVVLEHLGTWVSDARASSIFV